MNEQIFMVTGGKKTQQIEGSIEVAPTVGSATEAKQDTIIASIEDIGVTTDVKVTLDGEAVPVTFTGSTDVATQTTLATRLSESDFDSKTGSLTEGAPVSDTASSGLNGRLQRIAQRITSLIALLPTALGQGTMATSLKVVLPSDQSAIPVTVTSTTVTGTVAVTQSGTWDEVGINDSGNSLTVDAPVGTPVFVRLSDGGSAIATLPVSLASVPSHAVTATDLDIRNLVFATDKVDVTGSTVQDIPATSGGLSKFHLVGAATTNATNVKASAGQVYSITAFNITAVPIFLKFHNTAGTPTAGSGVTDTFLIPANTSGTGVVINIDKGITFATGIGITLVTGIADADATAIAGSSVVLNIYYK